MTFYLRLASRRLKTSSSKKPRRFRRNLRGRSLRCLSQATRIRSILFSCISRCSCSFSSTCSFRYKGQALFRTRGRASSRDFYRNRSRARDRGEIITNTGLAPRRNPAEEHWPVVRIRSAPQAARARGTAKCKLRAARKWKPGRCLTLKRSLGLLVKFTFRAPRGLYIEITQELIILPRKNCIFGRAAFHYPARYPANFFEIETPPFCHRSSISLLFSHFLRAEIGNTGSAMISNRSISARFCGSILNAPFFSPYSFPRIRKRISNAATLYEANVPRLVSKFNTAL